MNFEKNDSLAIHVFQRNYLSRIFKCEIAARGQAVYVMSGAHYTSSRLDAQSFRLAVQYLSNNINLITRSCIVCDAMQLDYK